MLGKKFSPLSTCFLLAVGVIMLSGSSAYGSEDKDTSSENAAVISKAQVQLQLMSFADRFVSILDTVIAKFETLNPQGKTRYEVLELLTFSAHHAFIIAGAPDPDVALLDMFSMITLGRIFFEKDAPTRYGDGIAPVLQGFRQAEADMRKVAAQILAPDQMRNLVAIVHNWRKKHPEVKSFPLIRFSNFAADPQDSSLAKAETPEGLFESVESASETAEEMRLLAERSVYMATRIPLLMGLFGDLWLSRWMSTPAIQQTLGDVATLSQSADRLASSAENLPAQITAEREPTIAALMIHVARERDTAINQLVDGIAAERKAALEELLAEEKEIEQRLTAHLTEAVERVGRQAENLFDQATRRLMLLVVVGWIGFIVAALFVRYVANRIDAFGNPS